MAATVLSGTGDVTYTNNTGQNVRVIINFYKCNGTTASATVTINWAGYSITEDGVSSFGRNLAFYSLTAGAYPLAANNMLGVVSTNLGYIASGLPTEIMLAAGQTFSVKTNSSNYPLGAYNIVVIPEAG